jgi:hypothetical protein
MNKKDREDLVCVSRSDIDDIEDILIQAGSALENLKRLEDEVYAPSTLDAQRILHGVAWKMMFNNPDCMRGRYSTPFEFKQALYKLAEDPTGETSLPEPIRAGMIAASEFFYVFEEFFGGNMAIRAEREPLLIEAIDGWFRDNASDFINEWIKN